VGGASRLFSKRPSGSVVSYSDNRFGSQLIVTSRSPVGEGGFVNMKQKSTIKFPVFINSRLDGIGLRK
jgi:hypothetical protein